MCALSVLWSLLALSCEPAWAHGGRPRPKPEPEEEEVEPPPPPDTPPPINDEIPTPGTTTPGGGSATEPSEPGRTGGTPATTPRPGRRGKGGATAHSAGWLTWWRLNRWAHLPDRNEAAYRRARQTTGEAEDEAARDRRRRVEVARQKIVPALLQLLHPKIAVPDEVRASALIALAKLSNDSATITLALTYANDRQAANVVRESAALSAGLVRRTDPALRATGQALDRLRGQLLALFDREDAPTRTRAFALFAVGLLGDQPFGSSLTRDGMMVSRELWNRLAFPSAGNELTVALLTALGMQPVAGIPAQVQDLLRRIAAGRRVHKRRWSDVERSHALTSVARLRGPGWSTWLMRMLSARSAPAVLRRAAWIALGSQAGALTADERLGVASMWKQAASRARSPATRGFLRLAQGRLLVADMASGQGRVLATTRLGADLLAAVRREPTDVRGFAALALGLAVREADTGCLRGQDVPAKFAFDGRALLQQRLHKQIGGPLEQGAIAVSVGLSGCDAEAADHLRDVVTHPAGDATLRGLAAVAVAQAKPTHPKLREALSAALWDRGAPALRSEAALALSFLPHAGEATTLVQEMTKPGTSQWVLGQIAAALGRLADLEVVDGVIRIARNKSLGDHGRGIAVAALALMADPEPRPSLFRLTLDANYPAATDAMAEAFTIL